MKLAGAALGALLILAGTATAQQLDFKRATHAGDETLSYRWRDAQRRSHAISFTLTRPSIRDAEESFAEFSMDGMWRTIEASLRDETWRFGHGARIEIARRTEGLSWTVHADDQRSADLLLRKLDQRADRDQAAYLARYMRQKVGQRIMVDFAGATAALRGPMKAVAHALERIPQAGEDDRARVALALGFFQEIPYTELEDKVRQGGDFRPAPALLAQNHGDCDSKAVALAAVLRTYAPARKLAVVTMPGHAILAVDLTPASEEATLIARGRQYVAVEPSGPAMAPIGQVGPTAAHYLNRAREIEIWPLN